MVEPNGVYTSKETQEILKISQSTLKRLLKRGAIRANKVGGQYRILGHEILHLISPNIDEKATNVYQKIKRRVADVLEE